MASPPKNKNANRDGRRKRRKFSFKRLLKTLLIAMLLAMAAVGVWVITVIAETPDWDPSVLHDQKQTSLVYDKDGNLIAQLHADENRLSVTYDELPQLVIDTFVAVEDKRFWKHFGIDPYRIVAAAIQDIKAGAFVQGASTITVQVAKNAFIENPYEKKLKRKIQEAVIAIQLERKYEKEEILTMYLNLISFGNMSFGIKAAADTYFGKTLDELTPPEVALLAGIPQAPTTYNPYLNYDSALKRRNIVLGVMRDAGIITEEEYNTYIKTPIELKRGTLTQTVPKARYQFPWFVDYVVNVLQHEPYNFTAEQIYSGGLRIYTTVDPVIQSAAEKVFADSSNFPKKGNASIPDNDPMIVEGAMAVVDSETGAVRAIIGGREYTPGGYNRAYNFDAPGVRGGRQPGSTIKPLVVYGPALEKGGYYPGTVRDDMPVSFPDGSGKTYSPKNYDRYRGLITMRDALKYSVNVYAVKMLHEIGIEYGWRFAKERLGLNLLESDKNLSLALGTPNVYPLDLASAYQAFANNGVRSSRYAIVRVEDANGNVLYEEKPTKERVMKETTAYLINHMLQTVVDSGTGTRANFSNAWAIAGKTGTSSLDPAKYGNKSGSNDAWFVGYTPKYVGAVWLGYDKDEDGKHYLNQVYGGSYPAEIWKKVMIEAHKNLTPIADWPRPAGITSGKIDIKSGLLPSSLTPEEFIRTEIGAIGDFPTTVSDVWVEAEVDADHPEYLASEYSLRRITKVFLNPPGRDPNAEWPPEELPYKMPTEYAPRPKLPPGGIFNPDDPSQIDNSLPKVELGAAAYDMTTGFVSLPLLSAPSSGDYNIMIYVQLPNQQSRSFIVTNWPNNEVLVSLFEATGGDVLSGNYLFLATVQDRKTGKIGPLSNSVRLTIGASDSDPGDSNGRKPGGDNGGQNGNGQDNSPISRFLIEMMNRV